MEQIKEIFSKCNLSIYGFCSYSSVGQPLSVRSAERIPKNAKSVFTFLFPYKTPFEGERNLSRYCIGKDYHDINKKKLSKAAEMLKAAFPQDEFVPFCDASPIRECLAAYQSGLGYLGKNSLIIHPEYGSYCFIGEIVTTLALPSYNSPLGFCKDCGACTKACPSGALSKGGVDTSKCLSALTQKKGELSEAEVSLIKKGGLVWGCDVCSDVCPMNKCAKDTPIEEFKQNLMPYLTKEKVSESGERAYGYKGKQILLRNIGIIEEDDGNNK